jgi:hypothetical protein
LDYLSANFKDWRMAYDQKLFLGIFWSKLFKNQPKKFRQKVFFDKAPYGPYRIGLGGQEKKIPRELERGHSN